MFCFLHESFSREVKPRCRAWESCSEGQSKITTREVVATETRKQNINLNGFTTISCGGPFSSVICLAVHAKVQSLSSCQGSKAQVFLKPVCSFCLFKKANYLAYRLMKGSSQICEIKANLKIM